MTPTPNRHGLDALSGKRLEPSRRPLEQARSLPAEAFTAPAVYDREVERLFRKEWLCAGRVDQIPAAGDYLCLDLLDEKLVVVRGRDGEIRVLSRICRHRAAEVARGSGRADTFVCPYHAWAYHLDGRLAGAPLLDRIEGFDRKACRLPEFRCARLAVLRGRTPVHARGGHLAVQPVVDGADGPRLSGSNQGPLNTLPVCGRDR